MFHLVEKADVPSFRHGSRSSPETRVRRGHPGHRRKLSSEPFGEDAIMCWIYSLRSLNRILERKWEMKESLEMSKSDKCLLFCPGCFGVSLKRACTCSEQQSKKTIFRQGLPQWPAPKSLSDLGVSSPARHHGLLHVFTR